jgi:hypothetical protein
MTELKIEIWERNTFEIEAVRVTSQNLGDVALWTGGEMCRQQTHNGRWYILVDTVEYNRLRQTKIFVGDWVIKVQGQFKHYRNDSLRLAYHRKLVDREKRITEIVQQALMVDTEASSLTYEDLIKGFAERIMDVFEGRTDE